MMWDTFWSSVIGFLPVLTVVVFVHELGHFLVARLNGVKVEVFSIGFGPELWGFTARSGTRWKLSALPLGGYVKMFGDADPASTPSAELPRFTEEERRVAFQCKKLWQRASIVAAGPLANFVFSILVMSVMFVLWGEPQTAPVIGGVQADSAAAEAGLATGDRVLEANGQAVGRFQDLQRILRMTTPGEAVALSVRRGEETLRLVAHPRIAEIKDALGNAHKTPLLGVTAQPNATEVVRHGPVGALEAALRETAGMVGDTLTGIGQMLAGSRSSEELGGPLRIAQGAGQALQLGIPALISFIMLVSINLGLVNLFPVPLLDGGHLLFYGIEALMGRPLGPRAQEYGFRVGLILVFALMIFATRNDLVVLQVWRMIKGIVS